MVVEITLESVGIAVGILGSIGAGASTVLVLFGNSKWATRKAVHDLADSITAVTAGQGVQITAHGDRLTKVEVQLENLGESLKRLAAGQDHTNNRLQSVNDSLLRIAGTVETIAGTWNRWKQKNGPLDEE